MTDILKKYLIIGPSWVGDMVMAQSLFIDIKQREPDTTIDVLAPAWTAALIDRMPEVNELIAANFNHGKLGLGERFRLGKLLRNKGYTHSINLPNSLKSALVPAIAKIATRSGFIGEQRWGLLNDIRKLDKRALPMTVQRFIALGLPKQEMPRQLMSVPAPSLRVTEQDVALVLKKNQLDTERPILVLCPGAEFGASKKWPANHYSALALHYLEQDWQVWLMGSDNDVVACKEIDEATGARCKMLAGQTTMPEAIDLISQASMVVSNDSGLMHIAAALQIKLVAVYGSTDPNHTPPLSQNHSIARLGLDCSPCFKRDCPLGHLNCLNDLLPERVIELCDELLASELENV